MWEQAAWEVCSSFIEHQLGWETTKMFRIQRYLLKKQGSYAFKQYFPKAVSVERKMLEWQYMAIKWFYSIINMSKPNSNK